MRHHIQTKSFLERGGFGLLALVALIIFVFDVLPALRLLLAALFPGGVFNPDAMLSALSSRSA